VAPPPGVAGIGGAGEAPQLPIQRAVAACVPEAAASAAAQIRASIRMSFFPPASQTPFPVRQVLA
jgi:hypothetical protein